jgi:2-oxoisovalerate dehydrogenase E1 component alpha subunit
MDYAGSTPLATSASAAASDEDLHDCALSRLRTSLRQAYPNHAEEIERNGLFRPAKYNYADTNSTDTLERAHRQMVRLREMDTILQNTQRQGRISFYMTCRGEEAIHFGAASALDLQDVILAQYREQGLLMWRGFTLQQFTDQCFSNASDLGKGRQMPIHYGSRALNYQTISSPLGTQIPQASGAAYRLKLSGKNAVAICFFGEGCTSTTDFHSGLNFAATLRCPVVFFCRNNGYAISTSVKDQYAGDGVVSRAPGYGMAAIRVDGNDIFAVHAAVREAREYALENSAPILIEAMSYRLGHHSTSDDSLRYRIAEEIDHYSKTDPLLRLQNFLKHQDYPNMNDDAFRATIDREKMAVLEAMRIAERKPKPPLEGLFEDVYAEIPASLKVQQQELNEHIAKYRNQY